MKINPFTLAVIGVMASVTLATPVAFTSSQHQQDFQTPLLYTDRNQLIVAEMQRKHVSYLVGDFWRIIPLSTQDNAKKLKLAALDSCTTFHPLFSPTSEQTSSKSRPYAYLLPLDKSPTDMEACNPATIEKALGKPSSVSVIAGLPIRPKELLLFYGGKPDHVATKPQQSMSKSLLALEAAIPVKCLGQTVMISAAHEDDDILFMNPDLSKKIVAGSCLRTVYVTAGDKGSGKTYWLERRQGAESAYNAMLGTPDQTWVEKTVSLPGDSFVTVASPTDNQNVTLIFLNFPDGNVKGQGFPEYGRESLAKLWTGEIHTAQTVDGQTDVTRAQLSNLLTTLMQAFRPSEIWAQSFSGANLGDHSDHQVAGLFTEKAYGNYLASQNDTTPPPIHFYIGYPIRNRPENLLPDEATQKVSFFESYAAHDESICVLNQMCNQLGTYEAYLSRQYTDN